MPAIGADAGLPCLSAMLSPSASLVASRKAKRDEGRERRRDRIRRNSLQLLVSAAGFHQYGEINVVDQNGGFVNELDRYMPHESQTAGSSVAATEPGSVSAAAHLLTRAFSNRPRPTGTHDHPDNEDPGVAISDEDSSRLRGGGLPSGFSFTPDGETLDWTEESDTTDGRMSESDSNSVFDDKVNEEELVRDIGETVEEIVGDLFDGDTTMSDAMRQQTKMRLHDHLLGQELARTTERRMRRGGAVGGNAGHQCHHKNSPRNVIFPINTVSPVARDGGHGYQSQTPDASLCDPLQWRMFYGLDSSWVVQGPGGLYTDNSAAANNEKQWASERSTTLAKNYIPFNGQGYNGEIEGYPLQASVDLFGSGVRPLTLAPRDAELLSTLDPATSVRYAFENSRMSLRAQSQSQRGRTLFKFKPEDYIDSSLSMNPDTPPPGSQEPLQTAAAMQQQSEIDAQLLGEAARLWDARGNANKGFHDSMETTEKPPFPISPPLPADYSSFAQFAPQRADERTSFPMSPVPSTDKLFNGNPTSAWQGRNLFEGFGAAAEPVTLQSMENQKSPFPMSPPARDDASLTPSESSTPPSLFGPSAATLDVLAAAKKQNEAWAQGPIPGLPARPAPAPAPGLFLPISEEENNKLMTRTHAAIPVTPSKQQRVEKTTTTTTTTAPVTPDTTQDVVSTRSDWEHEAARFRTTAGPVGQDTPLFGSTTGGGVGEDTTAYPATTPERGSSSFLGGARVRMPTVPRTRRVADRAIRAARRKISFAGRGRKPMY